MTPITTESVRSTKRQVAGLADAEMGLSRSADINYQLFLPPISPDCPQAKGLIFYIPGFGEDSQSGYLNHLAESLAKEHHYAVALVEYHCFSSRPHTGGSVQLTDEGKELLFLLCHHYQVPFYADDIQQTMDKLSPVSHQTLIKGEIVPKNNEYQNFGVLQALDHLSVIYNILNSPEAALFDANNIILIGSSHGSYIAHLIAKFAPNTINAVIDNSSYTRAPMCYIGSSPEQLDRFGKILLGCNVKTHWQLMTPSLPHYFGIAEMLIRQTDNTEHLKESYGKAHRTPLFYAYNSIEDTISPIKLKRVQQKNYQQAGLSYTLKEITPNDIDGKIFKTINHGMDASMKSLCQEILPQIQARKTTLDKNLKTELQFNCQEKVYQIQHQTSAPYIQLKVTES